MLLERIWACILINFKQHLLDIWPFQHRFWWCWAEGSRDWSHTKLLWRSWVLVMLKPELMPLSRQGCPCHVLGSLAGCVLWNVLSAQCLCFCFWERVARARMSKMPESVPGAEMILLTLVLNISFQPSSGLSQTGSRAPEHSLHKWDDWLSSSLPRKPSLATPALWECVQGSACWLYWCPWTRHFFLFYQLLLLQLGLSSLPYSFFNLLPFVALIRNKVEEGRNKKDCIEVISGVWIIPV